MSIDLTFWFYFLVDTLIRGQASGRRTMETVSDLQHVGKASAKLQEMIAIVLSYVDEVMVCIAPK